MYTYGNYYIIAVFNKLSFPQYFSICMEISMEFFKYKHSHTHMYVMHTHTKVTWEILDAIKSIFINTHNRTRLQPCSEVSTLYYRLQLLHGAL